MSRAPTRRPATAAADVVDSLLEAVVGKLEAAAERLEDIEQRLAALDGLDPKGRARR